MADEKERAEHVMLVDLGRNDLGRVCDYGTVQVDDFMVVETYSHVMHIVSSVSGVLREEVGAMDALRSVLPAGTLSGAPKVRAMEIIDELEPVKRGGYGGAIGWLSYTGDLDTCIHIRTVVMKDGQAHIQAGGGTVADAKPAYEYEESVNKARGVKAAIDRRATAGLAMTGPTKAHARARPRQLRLVHLQPRPVPGRAGGRDRGRAQRRRVVETLLERAPDRLVVSPGPCTPDEAGRLAGGGAPLPGGRDPDARRVPRPPVDGAGVRRHGRASRARPRQDDAIEHDGRRSSRGLPNPLTVGRYHSLVVQEDTLPDCLQVTPAGRRADGPAPPRASAEGVQFHPESVLTDAGKELLANFLRG